MKALKFYADWCGPCKGLSQVINNAGDKVTTPIEDINIDETSSNAADYKVRSVPTMILLNDQGAEVKRKVGTMNEQQLLEFLKG
jgi:thioredoxin-like negative regulator of GroEL